MVFIGPIFRKTIEPDLNRVGHGDNEKLKKELCRFLEEMSKQMHCKSGVTWLRSMLLSPIYIHKLKREGL